MNFIAEINIHNHDEIFAFRRKMYEFVSVITGEAQLASTIASSISEDIRLVYKTHQQFSIGVIFDRNASFQSIQLAYSLADLSPFPAELVNRLGLKFNRSTSNDLSNAALKTYRISKIKGWITSSKNPKNLETNVWLWLAVAIPPSIGPSS